MATAKTTSRKTTSTKKTTPKEQTADTQMEEILKLMKEIKAENEQLRKENEEIKKQAVSVTATPINGSKKVKCVNMLHNPLNVSTEPDGQGRVYTFDGYGKYRRIKFNDLADIVACYPNTMENGYLYICDPQTVEELGLSEDYESVYTDEMVNTVCEMQTENAVDMFVGMKPSLQESTAIEIAKNINDGKAVDLNCVAKVKVACGVDIVEIAENLAQEKTVKE